MNFQDIFNQINHEIFSQGSHKNKEINSLMQNFEVNVEQN